jgi:LysM repeat protein
MTIQHTVKSGETLGTIAQLYYGDKSQYTKIAAANPQLTNINIIKVGQVLNIPLAGPVPLPTVKTTAPVQVAAAPVSTTVAPKPVYTTSIAPYVPATPTPLLPSVSIVDRLKGLLQNKRLWIALAVAVGAAYYLKSREQKGT